MTTSDHLDVLVVGAGPAGAIAARVLAEDGFSVLCLEQGEWPVKADYPGAKPEWELAAHKTWHPDPNVRHNPADYPIDGSDGTLRSLNMFAGVGGSTVLYAAHWMRMVPSDFRVRTVDGVADDWPVSYRILRPYYEAIDQMIGVSGHGGDPAYPQGAGPPLPPLPIGSLGRRVASGMNDLGWHWWPGSNAIASRRHGRLSPCVRYGTCATGCPNDSKASFDLVMWPDAIRAGARLRTGARVREITVSRAGLATGAVFIDRQGAEHHQTADVVVLAGNAVGNARLLLLSQSPRFPDGLANSSGLVGRRLMTHPFSTVLGIFDEEGSGRRGPNGQLLYSLQFYETDASRGFVRGAKWALFPGPGPLETGLSAMMGTDEPEGPHRAVAATVGRSVQWGIIVEDLPDESNRVTLHDSLTDSDGVPGVRLVVQDDENAMRNMEFQVARAQESLLAAGAIGATARPMPLSRSHCMGTTVMGTDPATSVADQFGRAHDVPNLFLLGAGLFPTASAMNPTATLCALALRSAEHMIDSASNQCVPANA
jgi:choline dehydrogenase-like flavoprotein